MGTAKIARCRVCHRVLKNAAHIAAGVGPICAQRAARRASVTDGVAAYPAAKVERINRNVRKAAEALAWAQEYQAAARHSGTPEEQAQGDWYVRLTTNWYGRWRMIQIAVQRQQTARAW